MLSAQKKGFSMKHVGIIAAAAACILIFLFFPQKSVISPRLTFKNTVFPLKPAKAEPLLPPQDE